MSKRKAGPELDAQVVQEVMGWKRCFHPTQEKGSVKPRAWNSGKGDGWAAKVRLPRLSTDIAAAWEVLLWLRGQDNETQDRFYMGLAKQWREWCFEQETVGMTEDELMEIHMLTGTSRWFILHADIPLAICLAALDVVRENDE